MATNASKIDTATQKAQADAARSTAQSTAHSNEEVSISAIAEAVDADAKAPAAKNSGKKKTAVKMNKAKSATRAIGKPVAQIARKLPSKETIMNTAQTKATEYKSQVKDGLSDLQGRAKTAYDKSSEMAGEVGQFTKGNIEAMVESGKILASGMQEIGKTYVEDAKTAASVMTNDMKEVATLRSPTELMQFQSKIVARNFDATVAAVSKNTEAWLKLANEAFAPLSGRMSLAMDKVRKAA